MYTNVNLKKIIPLSLSQIKTGSETLRHYGMVLVLSSLRRTTGRKPSFKSQRPFHFGQTLKLPAERGASDAQLRKSYSSGSDVPIPSFFFIILDASGM